MGREKTHELSSYVNILIPERKFLDPLLMSRNFLQSTSLCIYTIEAKIVHQTIPGVGGAVHEAITSSEDFLHFLGPSGTLFGLFLVSAGSK